MITTLRPCLDKLEISRIQGQLPMKKEFVTEVNAVTAASFGSAEEVPMIETFDHLSESNLGHFVYIGSGPNRTLVAYALNDIYEFECLDAKFKVNYFASAFILPQIRKQIALYRMLGSMRLTHDEDIIMVRTQSPIVMTFFAWLCEFSGMRLISPLERVPTEIVELVFSRFRRRNLVMTGVYGRCLTGRPIEPKTPFSKNLIELINPLAGDAVVLVGKK